MEFVITGVGSTHMRANVCKLDLVSTSDRPVCSVMAQDSKNFYSFGVYTSRFRYSTKR